MAGVVSSGSSSSGTQIIAPLTFDDVGMKRANVNQCIREVVCCKNEQGKFGMRFKDVNKVCFYASLYYI